MAFGVAFYDGNESMDENKYFLKGALYGALVMLFITVAGLSAWHFLGADAFFERMTGKEESKVLISEAEQKIEEINTLVDEYYLYEDKIDKGDLRNGIYEGIVNALVDPYSTYYDESQTEEFEAITTGEYSGIGALLMQYRNTNEVEILKVYEETPAQEAGLQKNDILYKIDGETLDGDLQSIVAKIKGEEGSTVSLTVLRGEDREEVELQVVRRMVQVHTIEHEMLEDQVGYIQISEFSTITYAQFEAALNDLQTKGMQRMIVDLRGNLGGNLITTCEILDLLLPKGLIVYTEDKKGNREEYQSDDEHQISLPFVVLVDGNSASASEIFAGAVQDHEAGIIVGTTTYGKGVVQKVYQLSDGTRLKLTVSEYFTPNGRSIDGKGITPDVEVQYGENETEQSVDGQLEKAVEVVKEIE